MKKFSIISIVIIALLCGYLCTGVQAENESFTGKINAYDVNVRVGPSLNYYIFMQMTRDDLVLVRGSHEDWYKIAYPEGKLCWIHKDLVDEQGMVISHRANVRSGPELKHKVTCQLGRDDQVTVVKKSGVWLGIVPPDKAYLYVNKDLVTRVGDASVYRNHLARRKAAKERLIEADAFRDTSLRLSYADVDFDKIAGKYQFIVKNYAEFEPSKTAQQRLIDLQQVRKQRIEQERKRLAVLRAEQERKKAEWEALKKTLKYKKYRGILRQTSGNRKETATHYLFRREEITCYIRSENINLDENLYRSIQVWGYVLPDRLAGKPVLVVDKIKVVK